MGSARIRLGAGTEEDEDLGWRRTAKLEIGRNESISSRKNVK